MIPPSTADQYRRLAALLAVTVAASRRSWARLDIDRLDATRAGMVAGLLPVITAAQETATIYGASYVADSLADLGDYALPAAFVNPMGFVGSAVDGRPLASLLDSPVIQVKQWIGQGVPPPKALEQGGKLLDTIVQTEISDVSREAASVDIATRENVGWVRMLNPGACSRCIPLAGRWYRFNEGFLRHPDCLCTHVPSRENVAGDIRTDPYAYFNSLSEAEQDQAFGKADAQAIRDGADIYQVTNRRLRGGGATTVEGVTGLTPDDIYARNLSRDQTLALLEREGYILPGGQDPRGVIRGDAEGYGELGRGGTRVGVRNEIDRARRTGVRDPNARSTMTAAELRLFDAQAQMASVRAGRDPFQPGRRLTPQVVATVERNYRRVVLGY